METRNTEHSKIRQVAKDYEKNGYKVIIEPRGSDIPTFIKNYQPDLIATSDKDNVVVEVKTRTDFATIERLRDIADIINKRENWRFELIQLLKEKDSITRVWQKWRFSAPQTHLWLIKHWFSASTFVVKIATFAKPENVMGNIMT
jgi:Holliday junction resolvase